MNRKAFYDALRSSALFGGRLTTSQVAGIDAVLDRADKQPIDNRWLAYMLATDYHETAHTMQPVRETLADSDTEAAQILESSWKRGKLPWVTTPYWHPDANGLYWIGRGLVQLTHEPNYLEMAKVTGQPLDTNPALAMQMDVAVEILFTGMINGSFTGRKLADYCTGTMTDFVGMRAIINGKDRAADIAGYARVLLAAIEGAR